MNAPRASRRREIFLTLFLTIVLTLLATLFVLMISGRFFFAMLTVVAGLIVLGFLQF